MVAEKSLKKKSYHISDDSLVPQISQRANRPIV